MAQVILDPQDPQYGVSRPGPVTNFAIEQEFDGVRLYWTPPLNHDVDYFEIYRSSSSTFDYSLTATTKIAEVKSSNFVDQSIDTGTVYYWVRPVNSSGVYGPFTQAFITTDVLVTNASGDGSTVTISISGSAPTVDSLVLISGINPINYNGYKKVTEAGAGYFKYLGIEQGTYVSGGTVRQGLAATGASGDGTTCTVTFATQATAPFPVGSIVAVAGITPPGYDGYKTVTACTTTSVSYAGTTTESYGGGGFLIADLAGTGTGSTVTHILNFSTSTQTPVFVNKRTDGVATGMVVRRDKTTTALANGDSSSVTLAAKSNSDYLRNLALINGVYNSSTGNKVSFSVGSNTTPTQTYSTVFVSDATGIKVNNNLQTTTSSLKLATDLSSPYPILYVDNNDLTYESKFKLDAASTELKIATDLTDSATNILVSNSSGLTVNNTFSAIGPVLKLAADLTTGTPVLYVDSTDLSYTNKFNVNAGSNQLTLAEDTATLSTKIFTANPDGIWSRALSADKTSGLSAWTGSIGSEHFNLRVDEDSFDYSTGNELRLHIDTSGVPLLTPAEYTGLGPTGYGGTGVEGDSLNDGLAQFSVPVMLPTSLWINRPMLDADARGAMMVFADGDDKGGMFGSVYGANGLGLNPYSLHTWDGEAWVGSTLEGLNDVYIHRSVIPTSDMRKKAVADGDLLMYNGTPGTYEGKWQNVRPGLYMMDWDVKYGQWLGLTTPKPDPLTGLGGDTTLSQGEVLIGRNWTDTDGTTRVVMTNKTLTTDDIPESLQANGDPVINKWYTDARARAALSAGTGITYDPATGVISSSVVSLSLDELSDVNIGSTSQAGQILHYNGTEWTDSTTIEFDSNTYRPIFSNGTTLVGQQPAITLSNNTGATAYGTDDGSGVLIGVDSDSQSAKYFASLGAVLDTSTLNHAVRFYTSNNNFSTYNLVFDVSKARITAQSPIKLKGYTTSTLPANPEQGDILFDTDRYKVVYSRTGAAYDRVLAGLTTADTDARDTASDITMVTYDAENYSPGRFVTRALKTTSLTDIGSTAPTHGQSLVWDSGSSKYYPQTIAASNLDSLTDVVITSPSTGQFLKYNGTNWVNTTQNVLTTSSSIFDLSDVNIGGGTADGGLLIWSSGSSQFLPSAKPKLSYASGQTPFLSDMAAQTPTNGQVLAWNSSTSKWTPSTASGGSTSPAGSDTQIQFNNSGSFGASSALTWDGSTLKATNLESTNQSGDEGGEIRLNKAATNTTLTTGVTIDVYQNKLRIFETGGSNRGAYIDLGSASTGVGTNLVGSVSNLDGLSDVVITSPSAGQWFYNDGTNWVNSNTLSSATSLNTIQRDVTGTTSSFVLQLNRNRTDGVFSANDPVGIAMSVGGTGGQSNRFVAFEGVYSSTIPGGRVRVSTDNFSTATTAAQFYAGRSLFSGSIQPGTSGAGTPTAGDIIRDTTATVSNGRPKYYDSGTTSYRFVGGAAPVYTRATKPATGAVGDMIAISDASGSGGSAVNGQIAFWDTTNSRWSYIKDNSAV